MSVRKSLLLAILSFVVAGVAAGPTFGYSKEFDQLYPLQPGGSFELQNVNGAVEVQGWDRNEVEVRAVKTAKHKESDIDRVSIDVVARANAVSVATRYPQDEGVEVAVEYSVHVPYTAHIEHVATVNGTLRVAGVPDTGDLHTVNGDIDVFEASGNVHAHTTNGNVHLELASFQSGPGASAETTNGSVLLAVPASIGANLEARCLNGNFLSELPLQIEESLRPRETHGKLGKGGAPIRLRTVNGGIRVVALRSTV
jgi:hypothetical protein